jgi:hypothetical protein
MNSHLSDLELTDYLLGSASEASQIHLESCPACQNELNELKKSIQLYRSAATGWSENRELEISRAPMPEPARLNRPILIARWAMAAALVVFIAGFHFKNYQANWWRGLRRTAVVTSDGRSRSEIERDNELLSRLTSELSESVPAPMQPLQISQISQSDKNDH